MILDCRNKLKIIDESETCVFVDKEFELFNLGLNDSTSIGNHSMWKFGVVVKTSRVEVDLRSGVGNISNWSGERSQLECGTFQI